MKTQSEKKAPVAFSLDAETREALRCLADHETDGNMSQMIRRLVRKALAQMQSEQAA